MTCPLGRPWCTDGEYDDGRHICQSADLELDSGWSITLKDFHDGDGIGFWLADPDSLLPAALVGRLSMAAALDFLAGFAAAIRDAQQPGRELTPAGVAG